MEIVNLNFIHIDKENTFFKDGTTKMNSIFLTKAAWVCRAEVILSYHCSAVHRVLALHHRSMCSRTAMKPESQDLKAHFSPCSFKSYCIHSVYFPPLAVSLSPHGSSDDQSLWNRHSLQSYIINHEACWQLLDSLHIKTLHPLLSAAAIYIHMQMDIFGLCVMTHNPLP